MITPKCEDQVMGDLDVETFLLIVSVVLERAEDELELILIVVTPLRTTMGPKRSNKNHSAPRLARTEGTRIVGGNAYA